MANGINDVPNVDLDDAAFGLGNFDEEARDVPCYVETVLCRLIFA